VAVPSARLSVKRANLLRDRFLALEGHSVAGPDPIDFVHRYDAPEDKEVAAVIASALAFGRVTSFWSVLERVFDQADLRGGPAAWVDGFDATDARALEPIFYRWTRGTDLARLARTIGRIRKQHGSIGVIFEHSHQPNDVNLGSALSHVIDAFRTASMDRPTDDFGQLPQGYRYLLPHPASGSACKRWCMLLRWMTRTEAPDLGLWDLPTNKLVIPLDTHIHRIGRLIGLTHRSDSSWRTALEITQNLKKIDPTDPVRFDFALAHLGISGTCKGRRIAAICDACELQPACKTGQAG